MITKQFRTKPAIIAGALALTVLLSAGACDSDAKVASDNLSKAADQFEVQRKIGKHASCSGGGWDETTDRPAGCLCECHDEEARAA